MRLLEISHISHDAVDFAENHQGGGRWVETRESLYNHHKACRFLHLLSPIPNVPTVHKFHWLCPTCPHRPSALPGWTLEQVALLGSREHDAEPSSTAVLAG